MTSSSDWWGIPGGNSDAPMGLDDLDLEGRTLAMTRREDQLQTEAEELQQRQATLEQLVRDGYGEGTAERGAVVVRVDANRRVTDIQLTPKALHLGSVEKLRQALLDAIDGACDDIAAKLGGAAGLDARFSPLDAFIEAIPEVAAVLPESLRHPPKPPRPDPAPAAEDPEEDDR